MMCYNLDRFSEDIVREQADELIDTDKLASDFLQMYDKLGLLYSEEER